MVHDASLLYDLQPLPTLFSIGGVGGSCAVTHRGYLHCLPMTNDMNSAYLSPTLPVNLFSLGQMQRSGATYGPDPLRPLTHVSISSLPSGPLLAQATLSTHNLIPVNFDALHIASQLSPTAYHPSAFTVHLTSMLNSGLELTQLENYTLTFAIPQTAAFPSTFLQESYPLVRSLAPTSPRPLPALCRRQTPQPTPSTFYHRTRHFHRRCAQFRSAAPT